MHRSVTEIFFLLPSDSSIETAGVDLFRSGADRSSKLLADFTHLVTNASVEGLSCPAVGKFWFVGHSSETNPKSG
jgi:hypothetical protein